MHGNRHSNRPIIEINFEIPKDCPQIFLNLKTQNDKCFCNERFPKNTKIQRLLPTLPQQHFRTHSVPILSSTRGHEKRGAYGGPSITSMATKNKSFTAFDRNQNIYLTNKETKRMNYELKGYSTHPPASQPKNGCKKLQEDGKMFTREQFNFFRRNKTNKLNSKMKKEKQKTVPKIVETRPNAKQKTDNKHVGAKQNLKISVKTEASIQTDSTEDEGLTDKSTQNKEPHSKYTSQTPGTVNVHTLGIERGGNYSNNSDPKIVSFSKVELIENVSEKNERDSGKDKSKKNILESSVDFLDKTKKRSNLNRDRKDYPLDYENIVKLLLNLKKSIGDMKNQLKENEKDVKLDKIKNVQRSKKGTGGLAGQSEDQVGGTNNEDVLGLILSIKKSFDDMKNQLEENEAKDLKLDKIKKFQRSKKGALDLSGESEDKTDLRGDKIDEDTLDIILNLEKSFDDMKNQLKANETKDLNLDKIKKIQKNIKEAVDLVDKSAGGKTDLRGDKIYKNTSGLIPNLKQSKDMKNLLKQNEGKDGKLDEIENFQRPEEEKLNKNESVKQKSSRDSGDSFQFDDLNLTITHKFEF